MVATRPSGPVNLWAPLGGPGFPESEDLDTANVDQGEGRQGQVCREPHPRSVVGQTSFLPDGMERQSAYTKPTDFVFPSLKLSGKKPRSGSQFVKDYVRPFLVKHCIISKDYHVVVAPRFRHSLTSVMIGEKRPTRKPFSPCSDTPTAKSPWTCTRTLSMTSSCGSRTLGREG